MRTGVSFIAIVLWVLCPSIALAQCTTVADFKAASEAATAAWELLEKAKNTEICSAAQEVYRDHLKTVTTCAEKLRRTVGNPGDIKRPAVLIKVKRAVYGDMAHQHYCDLGAYVANALEGCNKDVAKRSWIGAIQYCNVSFQAGGIGDLAGSNPVTACGYNPSPYVSKEDMQLEVTFSCDKYQPEEARVAGTEGTAKIVRTPGEIATLSLGCEAQKNGTYSPKARPGYEIDLYGGDPDTDRILGESNGGTKTVVLSSRMDRSAKDKVDAFGWVAGEVVAEVSATPAAAPPGDENECTKADACAKPACKAHCDSVCARSAACRDRAECKSTAKCELCWREDAACSSTKSVQCRGAAACDVCKKVSLADDAAEPCSVHAQCGGTKNCVSGLVDYCKQ